MKLRLWGLFKSKNRHHKAPRGEEDGEIEKKRQISTGKCVSFKVPCFICSTRTNKAALMHHRDTGGRGTGGNREREREMKQRGGLMKRGWMRGRDTDSSGNVSKRTQYGRIGRKRW